MDAEEAKDLANIFDMLQVHYKTRPLQDDHDDDLFLIFVTLQIVFEEYGYFVSQVETKP